MLNENAARLCTGALLDIRCAANDHRALLSAAELPTMRRATRRTCAICDCAAATAAGAGKRQSSSRCTCPRTARRRIGHAREGRDGVSPARPVARAFCKVRLCKHFANERQRTRRIKAIFAGTLHSILPTKRAQPGQSGSDADGYIRISRPVP